MSQKWYQKSFFRNLVDMHINNGDDRLLAAFDPEVYAENMAVAGFDSAYIYGSNCLGLCLFDTKTGYKHQAAEKRDIFGETVEALRKRGIRPLGYLNYWTTECYNRHPDWRIVGADGSGFRDQEGHDGRYGVCCCNSPYQQYFLNLVRELCGKYQLEALWIDMVGFWRTACYCEHCKKLYFEETGEEIPVIVDWTNPAWRRYAQFKVKSFNRSIRQIVETAKAANPNVSVCIQSAAWGAANLLGYNSEFYTMCDYTAGDFYTGVRDQDVDCKFLRNVTTNQPFEYMVPRCPDLIYHTGSKPLWQLRQQAYASFLHGGAFLLIDGIDPAGTLNAEVYRTFRQLRDEIAPYWDHPSFLKGEYLNDLAVYVNFESMFNMEQAGADASCFTEDRPPLRSRLNNLNAALAERHIQYDILTDLRLDDLHKYPLVILSEIFTLTEREIKAFKEYVRGGGRLYISGRTGTVADLTEAFQGETLRNRDFALQEVMGVSVEGEIPNRVIYMKGREVSKLFSEADIAYPLGATGPALKVKPQKDTKVLATATLPYSDHDDNRNFLSAISDPPWTDTDFPVLTEHSYGKGKCVYCPVLLENETLETVKNLWVGIIENLLEDKRAFCIEASPCVEASIKKVDDTICVSMLNTLYHETLSPAGPAKIRISEKLVNVETAEAFPSGRIAIEKCEGGSILTASELPEYAVITIRGKV